MTEIKKCSICEEDLRNYGNALLLNGIMCRHCLAKTSKWLHEEDINAMTIREINNHLTYRENNRLQLASFKPDSEVKGHYSLYIDNKQKTFLFSKRKNYLNDNPDLIKAEDVDDMTIYIQPYQESEYVNIIFCIFLTSKEIPKIEFVVNQFEGIEKNSEDFQKGMELAYAYFNALVALCDNKEDKSHD